MSFLKSYFGLGGGNATVTPKEAPKPKSTTVRALPGPWYLSEEMFSLEKRSIFFKRWLLTTHQYRLPNSGDWQKYQMIDQHFVICRDSEGKIKAFHTDKDTQDFDISQSGLSPIHVHIDKKGFVWTNLDGSDNPVPWSEHFAGADDQERLDYYSWDQYEYNHTWEMEGPYNWKLLGDNYNECYHCRVSHPDLRDLADINTYKVIPEKSYLMHFGSPTPDMIAKGFKIAPTYFFPNASVNVSRNFFMIQRFIPTSPESSIMRYEVYKNKQATEEEFAEISDLYKRVMSEDKHLAIGAHANIKRGVFINGEMHGDWEKGAIWFQQTVRDLVTEHFEKEVEAGHQIWPLEQSVPPVAPAVEQEPVFKPVEAPYKLLEVEARAGITVS